MQKPKIIYGHFCDRPLFSIDKLGYYSNNKTYFIPAAFFELGLLASNVLWFIFTRQTTVVRGGFYEATAQHIETLPIPPATAKQKAAIAQLAEQCQQTAEECYQLQTTFRHRIADLAASPTTAKLTEKLKAWWGLDFSAFRKEVQKVLKTDIPLRERHEWESFFTEEKSTVTDLTRRIAKLEAELNAKVYELFSLTSKEIALLESSLQ